MLNQHDNTAQNDDINMVEEEELDIRHPAERFKTVNAHLSKVLANENKLFVI